ERPAHAWPRTAAVHGTSVLRRADPDGRVAGVPPPQASPDRPAKTHAARPVRAAGHPRDGLFRGLLSGRSSCDSDQPAVRRTLPELLSVRKLHRPAGAFV